MTVKTVAFYNRPFPMGGAETVTRNLAYFFHAQGIRVLVYTSLLHDELLSDEDCQTFEVRILPFAESEPDPVNVDFLRRSLAEERVDVLIVQCIPYFPFEALRRHVATRLIFCLHSTPLWEVHVWRQLKSREIFHPTLLRRMEFLLLRRPANLLTHKLERRAVKLYADLLPRVDRLVMLCPQYRDEMERRLRGSGLFPDRFPSEKLAFVSNPLLPPDGQTQSVPREKIVLYVGRIAHTHKRIDRLLEIWRRVESAVPDWRLLILGDGDDAEALHRKAARLRLQRVEFAGHRTDVASFYRRATFICLTSNYEGLPMCLIEAQQYGVIPVAFDSFASIRQITENGEAGIAVPAFDKRLYARRLIEAMQDEALQERMRRRSLESVRQYDPRLIGQQWLDLFSRL